MEAQIIEEIENGHYRIVDHKPQIVSALGAIPKNSEKTKFRLIHDASRPYGQSLNDHAVHDPFRYQSLQDAIDLIKPGDWLAKVDLKGAFRSVGIAVDNYGATGLKWRFKGQQRHTYFIDTRCSFGARRSPEIFNELTQSVLAIMRQKGFMNIVCYCDDFLIIASSKEECRRTMIQLIQTLRKLGFAINYDKVIGPAQVIVFLGIEINTISMAVSLPQNKLDDIKLCLVRTSQKHKISKRALQSLIGQLSWAAQVIQGGKFYLRRLLDRMCTLRRPTHRTRLTKEMCLDLNWWIQFMSSFNGLRKMVDPRPHTAISIDACKQAAGGHYSAAGQIVYTPWETSWPQALGLHINHLEVLALEPAIRQWAPYFANKCVIVHTDNISAMYTINKGISKQPFVMASLRRVFWLSAVFNFRLKAIYYPGERNILADRVSRLHEFNGWKKLQDALTDTCLHTINYNAPQHELMPPSRGYFLT